MTGNLGIVQITVTLRGMGSTAVWEGEASPALLDEALSVVALKLTVKPYSISHRRVR